MHHSGSWGECWWTIFLLGFFKRSNNQEWWAIIWTWVIFFSLSSIFSFFSPTFLILSGSSSPLSLGNLFYSQGETPASAQDGRAPLLKSPSWRNHNVPSFPLWFCESGIWAGVSGSTLCGLGHSVLKWSSGYKLALCTWLAPWWESLVGQRAQMPTPSSVCVVLASPRGLSSRVGSGLQQWVSRDWK